MTITGSKKIQISEYSNIEERLIKQIIAETRYPELQKQLL